MKKLTTFLLFSSLIFIFLSCSKSTRNENINNCDKFIGNWTNKYESIRFFISNNGENYLIEQNTTGYGNDDPKKFVCPCKDDILTIDQFRNFGLIENGSKLIHAGNEYTRMSTPK